MDLGLGSKDSPKNLRIINRNGSFNIVKTGLSRLESLNFYHYLVNLGWIKFILIIVAGYAAMNTIFALIYYMIGVEHIQGVIAKSEMDKFLEAFFFSSQSFTTVGYGRLSPVGVFASSLASLESLLGLLSLAIATGLMYGRFARPVSKIMFSGNAVVAPFKDITGFMFRMANKHKNQMQDVEVRVIFSPLESNGGYTVRKFYNLKLEYHRINFFPASWTVNHPIDEESPLFGLTAADFEEREVEFMILLQGFDDTFSQTVHTRYSYRFDEVVWGVKFSNIFGVDKDGKTTVAMDKLGAYENPSV